MLQTSTKYAPYADTRRCGILVSFEMVDVDAAATATASSPSACVFSKPHQTHNTIEEMEKKYATLERDFWNLDGSFILPDENTLPQEQTGFWSDEISDGNCNFGVPPILHFEWSSEQSSVGYTLFFDDKAGEIPSLFTVIAYDAGGNIIAARDVNNNALKCEIDMPVENYRAVDFVFYATKTPHRRVRVCEVVFGIVQKFNKNNVVSATAEYELSPAAESLATSEFTLTVDNADASWNMANPKGKYAYLQQTQPLDIYLSIDDESVFMGRYFFATASAEDDSMTAKITAYDMVYWLDTIKFRGGTDGTWTLGVAVDAVIAESGLAITTTIPEEFAKKEISRALPSDISCRDALCRLAQAANCSLYLDRFANLIFFDTGAEYVPVDELTFDNMETVPKITVAEKINSVELTVKNEYTEAERVWSVTNDSGDTFPQIAEYDNPVANNGIETATWLLSLLQKRITYGITERGNIAREIGDSVIVHDAYGGSRNAIITKQAFTYDGGISCETEAWC